MGILDDILGPIKSVISSLDKPVKVVENLFGEVITFTEEIVKSFEEMLDTLKDLFNASEVETMFLNPFKDAALTAVSSIEKLIAIAGKYGLPSSDGIEDVLMVPIKDAYSAMRSSLKSMGDSFESFLSETKSIPKGIHSEFARAKNLIETLPLDLSAIKSKIADEFKVKSSKAFAVLPDFEQYTDSAGRNLRSSISTKGQSIGESFASLEQSIHRRIENENSVIDFFNVVILLIVVAALASIFMITKSFMAVAVILGIIILSFLIFVIVDALF